MTDVVEGARIESLPQASPAPAARRIPRVSRPPAFDPSLPQPPDDHEKYSYVKRNAMLLVWASVLSFGFLVYSQLRMIQVSAWFWVYLPFLVFTVLYFVISVFVNAATRDFDLAAHRALVRDWHPETYPSVDVLLPVCGEPVEVLRNTWTHVALMAAHYRGDVNVYILDDSDSPQLRRMAQEFGYVYAGRSNRGWYKKAGNLLYGYRISRGEFILLLDADFAPRPDMLDETLPHMQDPSVGIVQTPQFFRVLDSQTWLERGAGAVQELFYRSVQTSLARYDGAICVGTCAVYRRAALDDNGGMTLIEHSEDVHTGFDLYLRGWRLRYLPIALSTGVCPDNIAAYVNQQYRWCSGNMSMLGSRKFWKSKLPFRVRLSYLSGFFYYVHTALMTFLLPLIPIALLAGLPRDLQLTNLIYVVPGLVYAGVVFPLWHRAPYRLEAYACRMVYGWAHVFTIWDVLRNNRMGWQPSGSSAKKQGRNKRFWIGMIGWTATTAVAWVGLCLWRMYTMDPFNFMVLLASGLFYAATAARVLVRPRSAAA
ncbi:glycosyltransferase [Actinocrinis puniceicyclus]|uniref:Glycosyltransferase n=2 Tax=Actinocrinis puniceicyclus TaxID=977794 RepID=A0A8J7WS07_9ACTN|nr:cellulose synthase catalytic subunit [Actinocrinis puniceicyclus]MBS2964922.1 glycosyltransferase [Actinocrinis puniceicyclus]